MDYKILVIAFVGEERRYPSSLARGVVVGEFS